MWFNVLMCVCSCPGQCVGHGDRRRLGQIFRQPGVCVQEPRRAAEERQSLAVGPYEGSGLQMSADTHEQTLPHPGHERGHREPRTPGTAGRQKQPGHSVEGHLDSTTAQVPAQREERQVQQSMMGWQGTLYY